MSCGYAVDPCFQEKKKTTGFDMVLVRAKKSGIRKCRSLGNFFSSLKHLLPHLKRGYYAFTLLKHAYEVLMLAVHAKYGQFIDLEHQNLPPTGHRGLPNQSDGGFWGGAP